MAPTPDNHWTYVLLECNHMSEDADDYFIYSVTHAAGTYTTIASAIGSLLGRIGVLPADLGLWYKYIQQQLDEAGEDSDNCEPIISLTGLEDGARWRQLDTPFDKVQFCPLDPRPV